jgi:hypothetical protein
MLRRTPRVWAARISIFPFASSGFLSTLDMGGMLMKKLKPIDVFGYNAEEFDEWWRESAGKMEKRTMRKFGSAEGVQPLAASRKGARKRGRHKFRDMETGNKF